MSHISSSRASVGFSFKFAPNLIVFTVGLMLIVGTPDAVAGPGDLDPTLGGGGIVVTSFTNAPYSDFPRSIQVQPDGRIVVCGRITEYDPIIDESITVSFFLARYNPNGTLDTSFGTNGKIVAPINSGDELVGEDIALQPDGKIVAVGYRLIRGSGYYFAVNRYNSDGTLDAAFGAGGKVVTQVGNSSRANSVAIQPDGKIVVMGGAELQSFTRNFAVVRYNSNGTLDDGFGEGGRIFTPVFHYTSVEPVMLQPDGKIIVAGSIYEGGGCCTGSFALVRYHADGSVDSDFGSGGIVIQTFSNADAYVNDALLQPDGRILVNGIVFSASTPRMAIVRYNSDGSVDTSFADNGIFTSPNTVFYGDGIALQPDGKIVSFGNYAYARSAVLRLNANGSLDAGFGLNGRATTNFHNGTSYGVAGAIQQNGRILFLGYTWTGGGDIVLARFLGDPVPTPRRNGKIAFTSDRDGNQEIYVMNADGSNQTRMTNNAVRDNNPSWSPDGRKIAFISQRQTGEYAIFQMNADGTGKTDITPVNYQPSSSFITTGWKISWSPDGSRLVFRDVVENDDLIFIVNADGSNRRFLIRGRNPTWSPDGSKILLITSLGSFDDRLQTIKPDGTDIWTLPPLPGSFIFYHDATWSPTGSEIARAATDIANNIIFISNADGTNPRYFHSQCGALSLLGCSAVVAPSWSPDGRTIAFYYWNGPSFAEIYVKDITGGEPRRLTNTNGRNLDPSWQPLPRTTSDFDGDGRTDISVFRPSDRTWYLDRSTAGFAAAQFGISTDTITPADYDGDGKTDIAVFRPSDSKWYIANSSDGSYRTEVFGLADDLPAPADYDGDGKADLCVFRPSDGTWYLQRSSNGSFLAYQFGGPNDKPTVGDFDGDGMSDFAVFRTTNGEWYQSYSSDGSIHGEQFGFPTDKLAYADYDGDGETDLAVFRPSDRVFYIRNSQSATYDAFVFGLSDDIPTPGDYDGDGKADLSVFRPSDGNWYRQNSSNGSFNAFNFGLKGDRPTPTAYQ